MWIGIADGKSEIVHNQKRSKSKKRNPEVETGFCYPPSRPITRNYMIMEHYSDALRLKVFAVNIDVPGDSTLVSQQLVTASTKYNARPQEIRVPCIH